MDALGASNGARTTPTQLRTSIKLKVKFAERILSQRQLQEGLEQCWILLPSTCTSVGHIAAFITRSFDLSATCPDGISLAMDGFTLPFSQSAALLQDSDLVYVRRLKVPGEVACTHSSLVTRHHHIDVTLYDDPVTDGLGYHLDGQQVKRDGQMQPSDFGEELSEMHKEHGALQIDWVEGAVRVGGEKSKLALKNVQNEGGLLESPPVEKETSAVGCEHDDQSGRNSPEQQRTLVKDFCVAPRVKGRRKKKASTDPTSDNFMLAKDLVEQHHEDKVGELVEVQPSSEMDKVAQKSKKKRKSSRRGESAEMKEEGVGHGEAEILSESAKKPKGRQDVQGVSRYNEIPSCQTDKKIGKVIDEHKRKLVDVSERSRSHESKKVKLTESQEEANRPSRSARRKKAKRRWLREQAEVQKQSCPTLNGVGSLSADEIAESEDEEGRQEGQEAVSYNVPLSLVDNEEDREDSVPVVDRPGHIRFEPLDDKDGVARHTLQDIKLGMAIMSKKQGQVWGQAKDVYKHDSKWNNPRNVPRVNADEPLAGVRCDETSTGAPSPAIITKFESLPALAGNPGEGDVLAYRLVELSSSWTPVLSVYRVGKVMTYDATSNSILLKPVDEYCLRDTFLNLPEQDVSPAPEDFVFPTPFCSDGSLEIGLTELVNVRLVQKAGIPGSLSNHHDGKGKKPHGLTLLPKDTGVEDSLGGDVDKAHDGIRTENHTILKLKAQPAQHRSVRALRAAALGPALARLRAQQEL